MNIEGLGEETIALLYEKGLLHTIADIYDLKVPDLARLERLGTKSARNIKNAVEASKEVPFARVLFALGIRYVGETVAKKLAGAFRSIDALEAATYDELVEVDEIGERIAQSVLNYFAQPEHRQLIERLKAAGLQFETASENAPVSDKLNGLSIVISGTFVHHSRDEYKTLIEQHGGKNISSVSAKANFILAGANMGPAKLEKAQKLGVKIIDENEFLEMIQL
jgi:DNA ligase (NAD+)